MRFILGFVCGIVLVVGFSYLHDTRMIKVGPKDPFVNWGTVFAVIPR
jgi:hypothetical protein